jgi:hypothetical protein
MRYYLLVYDRQEGVLREFREFGSDDRDTALKERFARELESRDSPHLEVIVLGAQSRAALVQTHARYFQTVGEMIQAASHPSGEGEGTPDL